MCRDFCQFRRASQWDTRTIVQTNEESVAIYIQIEFIDGDLSDSLIRRSTMRCTTQSTNDPVILTVVHEDDNELMPQLSEARGRSSADAVFSGHLARM